MLMVDCIPRGHNGSDGIAHIAWIVATAHSKKNFEAQEQ